jgi:hypothetical protein
MNIAQTPLHDLKDNLKIPDLWQMLGLPGNCRRNPSRAPWRKDSHPSLSIYDGGRRWKDHGNGQSGDAIDFLAVVEELDPGEAIRRFVELAGSGIGGVASTTHDARWRETDDQNLNEADENDDSLPYMDLIPEEHKIRKNGKILLSELGVIHRCTIVEQRHPEKAEKARQLRRFISAQCQKLRSEG